MPLSTDKQDLGLSDKKNRDENTANVDLSSDDLKGKKVDADVEKEEDKPADQNDN